MRRLGGGLVSRLQLFDVARHHTRPCGRIEMAWFGRVCSRCSNSALLPVPVRPRTIMRLSFICSMSEKSPVSTKQSCRNARSSSAAGAPTVSFRLKRKVSFLFAISTPSGEAFWRITRYSTQPALAAEPGCQHTPLWWFRQCLDGDSWRILKETGWPIKMAPQYRCDVEFLHDTGAHLWDHSPNGSGVCSVVAVSLCERIS